MSPDSSGPAERPSPQAVTLMAAITGFLMLGVLFQGVSAGVFARKANQDGLIHAHAGVAYVLAVLALAALVVAVVMWRGRTGGNVVVAEAAVLFLALAVEIGIGSQVGGLASSGAKPGLLAVHIPLALIIFGLSIHLSTFVAGVRRSGH